MRVVHKLAVHMDDRRCIPCVDAVQLDANTRVLELTLLSGGEAWEVPSGKKVSVAFRKSDGHGGWYEKLPDGSAACSVSGNVVSAVLAPEVLTCAGKTQVAVVIQDASTLDQIAAFPVTVEVARNPAAGQGISNNYFEYQTMADVNAALGGIRDDIGDMSLLKTSAKDDLVSAINEVAQTGGAGSDGNDGGHYTPVVTQNEDGTATISWEASREGMPEVDPATIGLPAGSGGTFEIEDGAVTPPKTSFLEFSGCSENLFDKSTTTDGYQIYQGEPFDHLVETSNMCVSDFIPVEENTDYCRSAKSFESTGSVVTYQYTFFYDADKNGLSCKRHYHGSKNFTTPAGCAYVRINLPMDCKDVAMVVKGATEPSEYVPYLEYYKMGDAITIGVSNIRDLDKIFEAMPDGVVTMDKLADEVTEGIEGVDDWIRTAAGWNDARQPTKKLTGRLNAFEHTVKGVIDITSDISDKTVIVHGVNHYDIDDLIPGRINGSTGAISDSTTGYYTNRLIPVRSEKTMYWHRDADGNAKSYLTFHLYDENEQWVRSVGIGGVTAGGYFSLNAGECYLRVAVENVVDVKAEKLCVADVNIGDTRYGGYDGGEDPTGSKYFGKNVYFPYVGYRIENGVLVGAFDTFTVEEITYVDVYEPDAEIEVSAPVEGFDKERLQNVVLKYGRYGGTDYVIARIFKNTINGDKISPRVLAFTPGGKKMSAIAKDTDFVMAINAGIFNTNDNSCLGTTISDGVVITDHVPPNQSGAGDTLGIDGNGDLVSIPFDTTIEDMFAAGITQAVHGWATIISGFAKTDLVALKETLYPSDGTWGNDYIVTAKHPRTAIGQYKNGDYMVFTCGGRETNQEGMTLAEMQDLFVEDGVKYAYNLDGGGSCNMRYYKRELAPFTENRADPSYIVFY